MLQFIKSAFANAFVANSFISILSIMVCGLSSSAYGEEEFEHFTAKVQSTWIWQKHPGLRSPYADFSSLNPNQEIGYSLSATAFLGARPWKGTEFFIDPEAAQGNPFSGLRGFGGMSNGEAQKAGGSDPSGYWARAFVRQTFGLGGESEKQQAGFNQFAGQIDSRRLVMTGGIYAITDIFDQNAFSHDPKTQFLNWAMMDYGAWDMPADARGYTRGLAIEYYHDDWAFRIGRNLLPVQSNGLQLNGDFSGSYSDNLEVEKSYRIGDQAGKVRALAFRNRAKFGNFNDALDLSKLTGSMPDVANTRKDQTKYGFGMSLEHNLTESIGAFARLSWNNGQTEAYSFTEINNSVLLGLSVKGQAWSRPYDVFGLAFASNGLSSPNIEYLNAGGQTFFCGDGKINYGREGIIETYYSLKLHKTLWATVDYQFIASPCYNRDRGPAHVFSFRLHFEM